MFAGLDSALHLAEESTDPQRTVPQAMTATVMIGLVTGFVFSVAMSYCIEDLATLLKSK